MRIGRTAIFATVAILALTVGAVGFGAHARHEYRKTKAQDNGEEFIGAACTIGSFVSGGVGNVCTGISILGVIFGAFDDQPRQKKHYRSSYESDDRPRPKKKQTFVEMEPEQQVRALKRQLWSVQKQNADLKKQIADQKQYIVTLEKGRMSKVTSVPVTK